MPQSLRKLLGSMIIVIIASLYALLATTIASAKLGDAHWFIHLVYFLVTGLLWIVPAMFIIKWMMKPDKKAHEEELN